MFVYEWTYGAYSVWLANVFNLPLSRGRKHEGDHVSMEGDWSLSGWGQQETWNTVPIRRHFVQVFEYELFKRVEVCLRSIHCTHQSSRPFEQFSSIYGPRVPQPRMQNATTLTRKLQRVWVSLCFTFCIFQCTFLLTIWSLIAAVFSRMGSSVWPTGAVLAAELSVHSELSFTNRFPLFRLHWQMSLHPTCLMAPVCLCRSPVQKSPPLVCKTSKGVLVVQQIHSYNLTSSNIRPTLLLALLSCCGVWVQSAAVMFIWAYSF